MTDPNRHHLIWSFFVESTGILEVFRKLLRSYLVSDAILKLNRSEDRELINLVNSTLNNTFPITYSSITPDHDSLRYNGYWRLFGYKINGKDTALDDDLKPPVYNSEFSSMFEKIMYEIFQGILDKQIRIERLANPDALARMLSELGDMLHNRTYNEIEDLAERWYTIFKNLRDLLSDDNYNRGLMVRKLNIRSEGVDRRLIELGEKLGVPVPSSSLYRFILADRLQDFIKEVEDTSWTPEQSETLFEREDFFKDISSAWYQVTGKDLLADALAARLKRLPI